MMYSPTVLDSITSKPMKPFSTLQDRAVGAEYRMRLRPQGLLHGLALMPSLLKLQAPGSAAD